MPEHRTYNELIKERIENILKKNNVPLNTFQ